MKRFAYNRHFLGGLLAVLLLLGAFNYVIDPFERNNRFDLGLPKQSVSSLMNYQRYKILKFEQSPQPVIILGDSRSDALRADLFTEAGLPGVFNFAYGGGTLYEALDTFWFAAGVIPLQRVILGVPFCIYSESNSVDRFPTARQVTRNPLAYYLSPLVTKAGIMNLLTRLTGHAFITENPALAPARFWAWQLGPGTEMYYGNWSQPKVLWERLKKVVEYCDAHHIELEFFIPPTHQDLQKRVDDFGLRPAYRRYKEDLATLAPILDYDQPGPLTADRDNFLDPYHFTEKVARRIVADLVRGHQ